MDEKKTSASNGVSTDVTSIFLPTFLRINISTHSTSGPAVYVLAGSAWISDQGESERSGQDVSDNYKGVDVDVVAGAGFEVARIIVEGRYVWGLLNVATNNILNSPAEHPCVHADVPDSDSTSEGSACRPGPVAPLGRPPAASVSPHLSGDAGRVKHCCFLTMTGLV